MTDQLTPVIRDFNQVVKNAELLLSITRATELQKQALEDLKQAALQLRAEKDLAIGQANEDYANGLLGCECVIVALIAELKMWMLLKQERPDDAWNELVTAQMATSDAMRAHASFGHLGPHVKKLEQIEQHVFPPQVFLSSGMIVDFQECSICQGDYDNCEHLIGKPYMGRFCYGILRNIAINHVSIVADPADKRCRVIRFTDDGVTRNRMTWLIEQPDVQSNEVLISTETHS
jgi:hypothetical protein